MRVILLTAIALSTLCLAFWTYHPDFKTSVFRFGEPQVKRPDGEAFAVISRHSETIGRIVSLARYDDIDYGFSLAIPDGWTRIVADDSAIVEDNGVLSTLEPGYAVGFESPRSGKGDQFADYILIEVLPGTDTGLFEATHEHRRFLRSGLENFAYDRLEIDAQTDKLSDVDLVIFQHGVQALGYTLSFYAIGEPVNEQALFEAFQILLRTYTQTADPFVVI